MNLASVLLRTIKRLCFYSFIPSDVQWLSCRIFQLCLGVSVKCIRKRTCHNGKSFSEICDSHGARTHDPNIKSVVLYQLS